MGFFHPIKHIKKIINLYDDLICTQLIKDSSTECLNKQCGRDEIIMDFLGMYDKNNVTYFYVFTKAILSNYLWIIKIK